MLTGRGMRTGVALAVAMVPLAPLYCPSDDPDAMACCARQANACNRPTAPDDDCCRDAPTDGQTLSASGALRVDVAPAGIIESAPPIRVAVPLDGAGSLHVLWRVDAAASPPRPPLILRI